MSVATSDYLTDRGLWMPTMLRVLIKTIIFLYLGYAGYVLLADLYGILDNTRALNTELIPLAHLSLLACIGIAVYAFEHVVAVVKMMLPWRRQDQPRRFLPLMWLALLAILIGVFVLSHRMVLGDN